MYAYAVVPDQTTAERIADELQAVFDRHNLDISGAITDDAPDDLTDIPLPQAQA